MTIKKTYHYHNKTLTFETGKMAEMSAGAVLGQLENDIVLATINIAKPKLDTDFFPLSIDFDPKYYASGKFKYNKISKREGRQSDTTTLISRMIDRPLRPMFSKYTRDEVQGIITLLQSECKYNPSSIALMSTSIAMQLAGLPLEDAVSCVRLGMDKDGNFLVEPDYEVLENGALDLFVAGTEDAILMVEAGANCVSDDVMVRALAFAHTVIRDLCSFQKDFISLHTITPYPVTIVIPDNTVLDKVMNVLTDSDFMNIMGGKKEVHHMMEVLENKVLEAYKDDIESGTIKASELLYFIDKKFQESMRKRLFSDNKRLDGRAPNEVRQLTSEVSIFPLLHGSALFKRGETQAFTVITIGGPEDTEVLDDPYHKEIERQYFHHYNFPPFCTGEVRRLSGPKRREVGHGALGERGLQYVIPTKEKDNYPYTVRATTEIMSSNGSTSMAAVCGQTLALMDAGVPLKAPVSGVAMGLIMRDTEYKILTDIQSYEDFDGDMDFKVVGTKDGITALQMDMKVKGLPLHILEEAFLEAKIARQHILSNMLATIPTPRTEMSIYAPRITTLQIDVDDIGMVIGKGGETIQGIQKETGATISIEESGLIMITSKDSEGAKSALMKIKSIVYKPQVNDTFMNCRVVAIKEFGAFIEYLPGKEVLVHISSLSERRINTVDEVLKIGDTIDIIFKGYDDRGREKFVPIKRFS